MMQQQMEEYQAQLAVQMAIPVYPDTLSLPLRLAAPGSHSPAALHEMPMPSQNRQFTKLRYAIDAEMDDARWRFNNTY